MRSSSNGGSAVASLSHRRANTELRGDEPYMGISIPEVERSPTQVASLFFEHKEGIHALAIICKSPICCEMRKKNLYRLARNDSVMHQHCLGTHVRPHCGWEMILELTSSRIVPNHALDNVENVREVPTGD